MKKIMVLTLGVIVSLVLSFPSFALELSVEAAKDVPSSYAKVVKYKDEDGKEKEKVVFGTKSLYPPDSLNQILNAYGVKLSVEAAKDVPSSYAKVVKYKDEDGKEKEKVVFGTKNLYPPDSLNQILNAYN